MRIAIVGATGFIGRALTARLQRDGHRVVAVSRDPSRARGLLGSDTELRSLDQLEDAVFGADGVVNLAGENVMARRWSNRRKRALLASRVDVTRRIVGAIESAGHRPRVFVSASAVGFYGDAGSRWVDERSEAGDDFLASVCAAWEVAARTAGDFGVRVVLPRLGVVLGPESGAWPALRRAVGSGFGATLGSGEQFVPWIHLEDAVEALASFVADEGWYGPVNVVAPSPLTNAELTRNLARHLGRSTAPRVPGPVVRLLLGERADAVLAGQRVEPRVLRARGFGFRYPDLESALVDLLDLERSVGITAAATGLEPLRWSRATHTLTQVTELDASVDEVFAYFSQASNLGPMTPAWTEFRILGAAPERILEGTTIDYRLKLGPVPVGWRTLIARWQPDQSFVDVQVRGPYRLWWHEHRFEGDGMRTRMTDTVHYALPFGFLGRLVHRFVVAGTLRRIFGFRRSAIALRFGLASAALRSVA